MIDEHGELIQQKQAGTNHKAIRKICPSATSFTTNYLTQDN
jgi:hypothetical protein